MKLLVINGPSLNFLGIRNPDVYGHKTLRELNDMIREYCDEKNIEVSFFQSNHEGAIIDRIFEAFENEDGIIINPAAFSHTSIAIRDALESVSIPTVEVHLSDILNREDFRKISYITEVAEKIIIGKGFVGYIEAVDFFIDKLHKDII